MQLGVEGGRWVNGPPQHVIGKSTFTYIDAHHALYSNPTPLVHFPSFSLPFSVCAIMQPVS